MTEDSLARSFEQHREHLRGVAFRMLGSLGDADDIVQETWLRLQRSDASDIANLRAWLTTVTARACLDVLRSRKTRAEIDVERAPPVSAPADPQREMELASSVGLALLVVLEMLDPAERLAFVLHDLFGVPFEEIAGILNRTLDATRQLASRARRRVRGVEAVPAPDVQRQRAVVEAFLQASRRGDFEALLAVLDPDIVLRTADGDIHGSTAVATRALKGGARAAQAARVGDGIGVVIAPRGQLSMVIVFEIEGDTVRRMETVTDPAQIAALELAVLD